MPMTFDLSDEDLARLRDRLREVGYTVDGVRDHLGPVALQALHRNETTPALRETADATPLAALIRLWLLQVPVPRARVLAALPDLLPPLVDAGILHAYGTEVCALVDVRPYGVLGHSADGSGVGSTDWWVVADLTPGMDGVRPTVPPDHVLGINSAATTLAQLTVRRPVGRALDIGTGCGVQALHLTGHADQIVATDVNPRALALARLTAALNEIAVATGEETGWAGRPDRTADPARPAPAPDGVPADDPADEAVGRRSEGSAPAVVVASVVVASDVVASDVVARDVVHGDVVASDVEAALSGGPAGPRLDLRAGSLFEPVDGELFDLVVSNPPFVISPRGDLTYRDSGLAGDEVCRQIVGQAPRHLAEGGVCQILANWLHVRGEDWRDRLAGWLVRTGCDAWVVQREVSDPADYVEVWLKDAGRHGAADYRQRYDEWLAWFEAQDAEAVGFGWITLRRPAPGVVPHTRIEEWTSAVAQPLGATVAGWLVAVDLLRAYDDERLLAARWQVGPDIDQEQIGRPGAAHPEHVVLRQRTGLCRAVKVDTAEAGFVGACDGTLVGEQIVAALAQLLEEDLDGLRDRLVPRIRQFVEEGYLSLAP